MSSVAANGLSSSILSCFITLRFSEPKTISDCLPLCDYSSPFWDTPMLNISNSWMLLVCLTVAILLWSVIRDTMPHLNYESYFIRAKSSWFDFNSSIATGCSISDFFCWIYFLKSAFYTLIGFEAFDEKQPIFD